MSAEQQTVRRSIFPQEGDTWETIAERELGAGGEENTGQLQSWNLHLFMRPAVPTGRAPPEPATTSLPSDVIVRGAAQGVSRTAEREWASCVSGAIIESVRIEAAHDGSG